MSLLYWLLLAYLVYLTICIPFIVRKWRKTKKIIKKMEGEVKEKQTKEIIYHGNIHAFYYKEGFKILEKGKRGG